MSSAGPPEAQPIRILIADDHALVRRGLVSVIGTQPDMQVVAEAASGRQAVELFRRHVPDLALVDLRMPDVDGSETTAAILREFPTARVVILTTYCGSEDIHRALQAGARSYLLKTMDCNEVLDLIRAVHRGERRLPPPAAEALAERMAESELTRRELEILELMSKGPTNREIGSALGITEGTVKLHVKSILAKLGASDRT